MNIKTESTYWVRIYISGPIEIGKQACREMCFAKGLCVTIEPTLFIYTGGEEEGFVVGIINYPRFPSKPEPIWERAVQVASRLLDDTCQHSVLLMAPDKTEWITKRDAP